jgi:hypothetical protein
MKRLSVAVLVILLSGAAQSQKVESWEPPQGSVLLPPPSVEGQTRLSEFFRFADDYCGSAAKSAHPSPLQSKCLDSATGKWQKFADDYCAIKLEDPTSPPLSRDQLRCLHQATTKLLQKKAEVESSTPAFDAHDDMAACAKEVPRKQIDSCILRKHDERFLRTLEAKFAGKRDPDSALTYAKYTCRKEGFAPGWTGLWTAFR